jgi:hypothetical protein
MRTCRAALDAALWTADTVPQEFIEAAKEIYPACSACAASPLMAPLF